MEAFEHQDAFYDMDDFDSKMREGMALDARRDDTSSDEEGGSGSIQLSGDETHSSSSSTCSTPTPHLKREAETETSSSTETERFSYDIDPDIGVIVWK